MIIFISFIKIIRHCLAFLLIALAWRTVRHFDLPRDGLYTGGIILLVLTLVCFVTGQMQNWSWARILTVLIWFWASFYIFHVIDHGINFLQQIDFVIGQVQISLLTITRAAALTPVNQKSLAYLAFLADNSI